MVRLFIGSNNKTKRLELDKIVKIVSSKYEGFTYYTTTGFWQGVKEKSAVVEIGGVDKNGIDELCKVLCSKLSQQAVGVQEIAEMSFVSL